MKKEIKGTVDDNDENKCKFCIDTVFKLSNKVLSDSEIKSPKKGLDLASIQQRINKPELRTNFKEFFRRMRVKLISKMNVDKILVRHLHLE